MRTTLRLVLPLTVAMLGGCVTGFPPPPPAHPEYPTDAQLEEDTDNRSARCGRSGICTESESLIARAAIRVILGPRDAGAASRGGLPPEWSVDALAVGATGQRARLEIAHHGYHGRHPWTGWKVWLVKDADGAWRVTGLSSANIC